MKIAVTSKSFSKNEILIHELKRVFGNIKLNFATKKLTDEELIEFLQDCSGVILALEDLNKKVLDRLPNLEVVSKFGVGLDNIDIKYCNKKNVKVLWEKGTNKQSVAEITLGFMLMLLRKIYISSNELSKGVWNKDGGVSLYGRKVGIIGVGNIGKELVELLKPFACKIYVNDVINQDAFYRENGLIEASKEEIFKTCDIVTLHVSLNKQTRFLINKNVLESMKKEAFLINTSRGEVVQMQDLKSALLKKQIAGAALDVYDIEPPEDLELLGLENFICTPHIGGNSKEAVLAMGRSAIDGLKKFYNKDKI